MFEECINKAEQLLVEQKSEIIAYLKNKYDEDFEVLGRLGQSRGLPADLWGCRVLARGHDTFTVTGNNTEKGYVIRDSYFRIYVRDEYEGYVRSIIDKMLDDYTLDVGILLHKDYPHALDKNANVADIHGLLEDGAFKARIKVTFDDAQLRGRQFKDVASEMCNELAGARLNAWLTFLLKNVRTPHDNVQASNDNIHASCDMEGGGTECLEYYVDEYSHAKQKERELVKCGITFENKVDNNHASKVMDEGDESHGTTMMDEVDVSHGTTIDEWQCERLCCLVYLDSLFNYLEVEGFESEDDGLACIDKDMVNAVRLYDVVSFMITFGYDDSIICGHLPNDMDKDDWDKVLYGIINDPYLCGLKVVNYVDINERHKASDMVLPGHRAICLMDGQHNAVVIFRGTCGDKEWLDNAYGLVVSDSRQQVISSDYVRRMREDEGLGIRHLTVAGHSKGGNKAQYATIVLPRGYVDQCVSINGQGFSPEFVRKYESEINQKKDLIILLAEKRDCVNCLGIYVAKPRFYEGGKGEHDERHPYGQPIMDFHNPDSLRGCDGHAGNPVEKSSVSSVVNAFMTLLLTEDRLKDIREETAINLISLVMIKKISTDLEIAETIKNLMFMSFIILAENEYLYDCLSELILSEPDVVLASMAPLYTKDKNVRAAHDKTDSEANEPLLKAIRKRIIVSLITDYKNLANSQRFLKNLIAMLAGISEEVKANSALFDYIYKFVESMFDNMEENASPAVRLIVSGMRTGFLKVKLNIQNMTHEELFQKGLEGIRKDDDDFDEETLMQYMKFSLNAYTKVENDKEKVTSRKLGMVEEATELLDGIYVRAYERYKSNKGRLSELWDYWNTLIRLLKVDLFFCQLLEEEDIYKNDGYRDDRYFFTIYTGTLDRVICHSGDLTIRGRFLYDMYKFNGNIDEYATVKNELDKHVDRFKHLRMKHEFMLDGLDEGVPREGRNGSENVSREGQDKPGLLVDDKDASLRALMERRKGLIEQRDRLVDELYGYKKILSGKFYFDMKKKRKARDESTKIAMNLASCCMEIVALDNKVEAMRKTMDGGD